MADIRDNSEYGKWQPIETAPKDAGQMLLFFPEKIGRGGLGAMIKVDRYPVSYPRQPSHWAPIPPAPEAK